MSAPDTGSAYRTRGTRTRTTTRTTVAEPDRAMVRTAVRLSAAGRAISRAAGRAATWLRETTQPPGVLVLLVASFVLVGGLVWGWAEWISAGVIALVLVLIAIPFLFGARSYRVDLDVTRDRVVAGSSVTGRVVVTNVGTRPALPGRIDLVVGPGLIEFGVPVLRSGAHKVHPVELPRMRRGVVDIGPATTVRADPLGLFRREHSFADIHRLFVHPVTAQLPSTRSGLIRDLEGAATRQLVDADMSFHAIRDYMPGDSWRQVHWKSTAKTGQLMVRQYEQTRRSRMAVVLGVDQSESATEDEFELAVSCAASLALRAVHDSRDIDVVTASEVPRMALGRVRAIDQLPVASPRVLLDAFSAVTRVEHAISVAEVCQVVAQDADRLSAVVVVAGSTVKLGEVQRAALSFEADTAVIAVVCDEHAAPGVQALSDLTVITVATLDDLVGLLVRGATS